MDFKLNRAVFDQLAQQAVEQLQPQYNAALQDEVRQVRDEMEGQTVDDVYAKLISRLRTRFGDGFTPNEAELREVAQAISDGELED